MSIKLKEIFEKEYMKGYFHRNKKIFIVSILLFFILGSIGTILDANTMNMHSKGIAENVPSNNNSQYQDSTFEGFIVLFIHNFIQDFTAVIGGLLLFIPTLFITFVNATNMITLFVKGQPLLILLGVLPHGIFEIPSSFFAIAGGMMLFITELNVIKALIKRESVKEALNDSENLIKDVILTVVIIFVLLLLAALVETFITPVLLAGV